MGNGYLLYIYISLFDVKIKNYIVCTVCSMVNSYNRLLIC